MFEHILLGNFFSIYGGRQEFLKVNSTAAVNVNPSNNLVDITYVSFQPKLLSEYVDSLLELIFSNRTVPIVVKDLEYFSDLEFFLTRNKLRCYILEYSCM